MWARFGGGDDSGGQAGGGGSAPLCCFLLALQRALPVAANGRPSPAPHVAKETDVRASLPRPLKEGAKKQIK